MIRSVMICLCGVLSACGPLTQGNPVLDVARGATAGLTGDATAAESTAPGLSGGFTRAFIEAQPNELMFISIVSREAVALVVRAGNNGDTTTWISPDGISVSFNGGFLVGTRGLGVDVMGADVSAARSAFASSDNYLKTVDYLGSRDQIVSVPFECSMALDRQETIEIVERSYDTQVYIETCSGTGRTFQNLYWRDSNGVIWQAQQWISAEIGYLGYQRL